MNTPDEFEKSKFPVPEDAVFIPVVPVANISVFPVDRVVFPPRDTAPVLVLNIPDEFEKSKTPVPAEATDIPPLPAANVIFLFAAIDTGPFRVFVPDDVLNVPLDPEKSKLLVMDDAVMLAPEFRVMAPLKIAEPLEVYVPLLVKATTVVLPATARFPAALTMRGVADPYARVVAPFEYTVPLKKDSCPTYNFRATLAPPVVYIDTAVFESGGTVIELAVLLMVRFPVDVVVPETVELPPTVRPPPVVILVPTARDAFK